MRPIEQKPKQTNKALEMGFHNKHLANRITLACKAKLEAKITKNSIFTIFKNPTKIIFPSPTSGNKKSDAVSISTMESEGNSSQILSPKMEKKIEEFSFFGNTSYSFKIDNVLKFLLSFEEICVREGVMGKRKSEKFREIFGRYVSLLKRRGDKFSKFSEAELSMSVLQGIFKDENFQGDFEKFQKIVKKVEKSGGRDWRKSRCFSSLQFYYRSCIWS